MKLSILINPNHKLFFSNFVMLYVNITVYLACPGIGAKPLKFTVAERAHFKKRVFN